MVNGRLFDLPALPILIFVAANGRKSMRLAGKYGKGPSTDSPTWREFKYGRQQGAREPGERPDEMPTVLLEQFVIVSNEDDAQRPAPASLWHFLPMDPAAIEKRVVAEWPIKMVVADRAVSPNPEDHVTAMTHLVDTGATIINVYSVDQQMVIDFYGNPLPPDLVGRQRVLLLH